MLMPITARFEILIECYMADIDLLIGRSPQLMLTSRSTFALAWVLGTNARLLGGQRVELEARVASRAQFFSSKTSLVVHHKVR